MQLHTLSTHSMFSHGRVNLLVMHVEMFWLIAEVTTHCIEDEEHRGTGNTLLFTLHGSCCHTYRCVLLLKGLGSEACYMVYDRSEVCRPIEANVGETGRVGLGDTFHTYNERNRGNLLIPTHFDLCFMLAPVPKINCVLKLFPVHSKTALMPALWPLT